MSVIGTRNETSREAWLERTLRELPSGLRILDAGAGEKKLRRYCPHLDYVSQDFGRYDGKGNGRGLQTGEWDQSDLDIVSDIASIPEPAQSFDAISCIEVLEHLPNPLPALTEFNRLLKPNGRLILTAPFCSLTHFAPYHFCTGFSRYFFETHLLSHGFSIEELVENGNYFEYLAQEIRRLPAVAKTYCGGRMSKIQLAACWVVLRLLGKLSRRDQGSAALLHFGCFVKARKERDLAPSGEIS